MRATLLTTEPSAAVLVACGADTAELRVELAPETVTLLLPQDSDDAAFRDQVLGALDEALQDVARRRGAPTDVTRAPTEASATSNTPAVEPPLPFVPPSVAVAPHASPKSDARAAVPAAARSRTEFVGSARLELWSDRLAGGGALGAARFTSSLGLGVRVGVLRAATSGSRFAATEGHAAAEVTLQPAFAAGFRASVGLGGSALFVTADRSLTPKSDTTTAALFFALQVTRPFRFGHFGLVPGAELRMFTAQRGVRIDANERLKLPTFVPQLSVGLAYYVE